MNSENKSPQVEYAAMRLAKCAERMQRLIQVNAPPVIIANERVLLEKFYNDWTRALNDVGVVVEPTLEIDDVKKTVH